MIVSEAYILRNNKIMKITFRASTIELMVAYLLVCSTSVMAQMSRTLTPADLLKREEIDDFTGVRIAPNGQDAAFVRRRSVASAMNSHQPFIADEERSDIWIVSLGAGTSRSEERRG